jgi:hypothetical protein
MENNLKTSGVGSFGGEEEGPGSPRLFRVEAGYSADMALLHSSQLMACVHKLTLEAGTGQEGDLVWAAHYLSGMAKALVEDVAHSIAIVEK